MDGTTPAKTPPTTQGRRTSFSDDEDEHPLSAVDLLEALEGVIEATRLHGRTHEVATFQERIRNRLATHDKPLVLGLRSWKQEVAGLQDDLTKGLVRLALGIALLRQRTKLSSAPEVSAPDPLWSATTVSLVWGLVHEAIVDGSIALLPQRSAQGFLAAPLFRRLDLARVVDQELICLRVWPPDETRGAGSSAGSSYRFATRAWVLAGKGTVHASKDLVDYAAGDMSYIIPANVSYHTEVDPEEFHAALFHLEASTGSVAIDSALGPRDGDDPPEDIHNPGDYTVAKLVDIVDTLRGFESLIQEGRQRAGQADWEPAQRAIRNAIDVCTSPTSVLANEQHYLAIAVAELGNISRRFGHYDRARAILEELLTTMTHSSLLRAEICGELGIICRHLGRLEEAKNALGTQYAEARELGWEQGVCRAIGNLGMINYQLWQATRDEAFLDEAMRQLQERVEHARRLKDSSHSGRTSEWNKLNAWEGIGLARLSLCHTAQGMVQEAIETARASLDCAHVSRDPTVVALSRLFYGRALLLDGRRNEALAEFNPSGTCTPAMALCKEPSEEYRGYLSALVDDEGVQLDVVDEQGYSALDYAVFSGDRETERLVVRGLARGLPGRIVEQYRTEAYLRKGYRELFQEALRPVLLESKGRDGLQRLRVAYADALAADPSKAKLFDRLKFVRYRDFERFGRLPVSTEGRTQGFDPKKAEEGAETNYIIFVSYTWCNTIAGIPSPDDESHTQYHRMLVAIKAFLALHPSVGPDKLGIWLDYACVDQRSPMAGINALPLNLMQCNVVISLIDERYYSRAWCSVEVLIVQTLRRAWGMHSWYVCDREGLLAEGPRDLEIEMEGKKLTYEEERPKLVFLERQSKLLG